MRIIDVLVAAALVVLPTGHGAAAEPASLEIVVTGDPVRVGDRVPVRVAARGGEDLLWGDLRIEVAPDGPWAIVEDPREVEGARPPVWEFVLAPMKIEDLALPAIVAMTRDSGGTVSVITADDVPSVTVTSVLPENEESQPVPLRDPVGVSGFPWEWVLPLAVPIVFAAAGMAWWSSRRKSKGGPGRTPVVAPLAELEALLERLRQRIGREPAEGICDRLAAGVRHYLGRQSEEPAEDMTSFELRLMARRLGWPETVQRGLQDVMAVADIVRFGRVETDEARLARAVDLAGEVARVLDRQLAAEAEAEDSAEVEG